MNYSLVLAVGAALFLVGILGGLVALGWLDAQIRAAYEENNE